MTDSHQSSFSSPRHASSLTVSQARQGQRLDNFLLSHLKKIPRSLVYKLVRTGQVRVNGRRAKAEHKLCMDDVVRIPDVVNPARCAATSTEVSQSILKCLQDAIVFEDSRLLVLNKPSGIACHGGSGITHGVIEGIRVLKQMPTLELVHRLDRDTSGILVLAKKRSALTQLHALMRSDTKENAIEKRYIALLVGHLPNGCLQVDAPLHTFVRQGGERHVQVHPQGKASLSAFTVIARRGGYSLCSVQIFTGRTHQIRVHAQHLGFPIAGDDKYGDSSSNKHIRQRTGLHRLFLHAAELAFALEDGAVPYRLQAPLPLDLSEVFSKLA